MQKDGVGKDFFSAHVGLDDPECPLYLRNQIDKLKLILEAGFRKSWFEPFVEINQLLMNWF